MPRTFRRRKVTLTVELDAFEPEDISDAALQEHLERALNYFDDGRYSFARELVARGFNDLVNAALQDAVSDLLHRKYPDRWVTAADGSWSVPVSSILAERRGREISASTNEIEVIGVATTSNDLAPTSVYSRYVDPELH